MAIKKIPDQFDHADTVEEIAKELIPKYHDGLVNARIAYLFKNKPIKKKGREVIASIKTAGAMINYLTDYNYILVASYPAWNDLTDKQKVAVVDHELAHCLIDEDEETGEPIYKTIDHDFSDFYSVVERNGCYLKDLYNLKRIMGKAEEPVEEYEDD